MRPNPGSATSWWRRRTSFRPARPSRCTIEDYAWSDDARKLLLFTNTKRVWRKETRGDYWVFDRRTRELKKLGGEAPPSTLMFATFSPDGQRVAYVCQNNLFVQSLDNLRIKQLTTDGSATIINGTADWVNEEEFGLRNGLRWSPDGKFIAYWQFDTTGVREFKLINNTDRSIPRSLPTLTRRWVKPTPPVAWASSRPAAGERAGSDRTPIRGTTTFPGWNGRRIPGTFCSSNSTGCRTPTRSSGRCPDGCDPSAPHRSR